MSTASDYLLIGGGLAAKEAARNLRKQDPDASILLVSQEPHLPYDRPPLTKQYMQGKMARDELFYEPADFFSDSHIQMWLGTTVTALNPAAHTATVADGRTIQYGKALIATGGRPVELSVPGAHLSGLFYLRSIDDCEGIRAAALQGKRAVIVGAGFIGLELAASLTTLGIEVHILEMAERIWPRFADAALANYVQQYCEERGVSFHTGERLTEVVGDDRVQGIRTASGLELDADLVIVGIGIRPNVELAKVAGLAVDNGIVVDEQLRTSDTDIYAAGDVINYPDQLSGRRRRVEHWSHANFCGRLAAMNMAGQSNTYNAISFVWSDIFDLALKFLGDEHQHDRVLRRGEVGDDSFAVLYLANHRVVACFVVNGDPREFSTMRRLIQNGVNVEGKDSVLTDPAGDLKTLL